MTEATRNFCRRFPYIADDKNGLSFPYITDDKTLGGLLALEKSKPYLADFFPYLADDIPYLTDIFPYIADDKNR